MRSLAVSLITMFAVLGCSNQWRNIDVSFSRAGVVQGLDEEAQYASSWTSGGYADSAFWYLVDSGAPLYYSESSEYFGTVPGVLSFTDLTWLDPSLYTVHELTSVKVYLLFDSASGPSTAALMVSYSSPMYSTPMFRFLAAQGSPRVEGGKLILDLMSDDGMSIQLQSRDIKGSDLKSVMQFQVYQADGSTLIGKFSTLVKVD